MSPEYVRPYVKAQKNDDRDAEAIAGGRRSRLPWRPRRAPAWSGRRQRSAPHAPTQHDLMSPEYVRPYVKAQKNDDRDAEAIAEAATRPTMRFVPAGWRGAGSSAPCARRSAGHAPGAGSACRAALPPWGHTIRLMSPEYVRPYVKAQKNDDRDAEAIAEAATRAEALVTHPVQGLHVELRFRLEGHEAHGRAGRRFSSAPSCWSAATSCRRGGPSSPAS
jgi:transposase